MASPVDRIARNAAARLAQDADLPLLVPEVERQLQVGDDHAAADRYEPIAISLAALIVSVAGLAWTIYTDLKKQTRRPDPEVMERRIRVEIEHPEKVSAADRDRVITTVIEQMLDGEPPRDRTDAGDERHQDQRCREDEHDPPDQGIGVARGGERLDLVPEGVQPQPRLPWPVPGLVHHAPLLTEQVLASGLVLEVAARRDEQDGFGVVGLVELAGGQERAVQATGPSLEQQRRQHGRDGAVIAGWQRRLAVGEGHLVQRLGVRVGPGGLL